MRTMELTRRTHRHTVPLSNVALSHSAAPPPPPVSATSFSAGNCGQDIFSRNIPEIKNLVLNDFFLTKYVVIIILVN